MPHPLHALLAEYKIAIDQLVPTVPESVRQEAASAYEAFVADESVDEKAVRAQLLKTGLAEYPHRHAFHALTDVTADAQLQAFVLDHLDADVRAKVEGYLNDGVPLGEFVKSELFETQLSADERYQVEHGILDARDHVEETLAHKDLREDARYQKLVSEFEKQRDAIAGKIEELEAMKTKDAKWKEEIEQTVKRLQEGFLVTERDPTLEEVEKEIEYWQGTLGELD